MDLSGQTGHGDLVHVLLVNEPLDLPDEGAGAGVLVLPQKPGDLRHDLEEKPLLLHVGQAPQPVLHQTPLVPVGAVLPGPQPGHGPGRQEQQAEHEVVLILLGHGADVGEGVAQHRLHLVRLAAEDGLGQLLLRVLPGRLQALELRIFLHRNGCVLGQIVAVLQGLAGLLVGPGEGGQIRRLAQADDGLKPRLLQKALLDAPGHVQHVLLVVRGRALEDDDKLGVPVLEGEAAGLALHGPAAHPLALQGPGQPLRAGEVPGHVPLVGQPDDHAHVLGRRVQIQPQVGPAHGVVLPVQQGPQGPLPVEGGQPADLLLHGLDPPLLPALLVQPLHHPGDGGGQLVHVHGLEDIVDGAALHGLPEELHVRVAADEHDLHGGELAAQLLGQGDAVHMGRHHVGDHQLHRMLPDIAVGLLAVGELRRHADAVALPVKVAAQPGPDGLLVVNDNSSIHGYLLFSHPLSKYDKT